MKKIRAGQIRLYVPNLLDQVHNCAPDAKPGDLVKVVKLHSAPPPGTMGQCHVESMKGEFLGMVSCNSLYDRRDGDAITLAASMRGV